MMNQKSESENIDRSLQVRTVLNEIQESRSSIQLLLPECNEIYNSHILVIQENDNLMLLDTLNPNEGNEKLADNTILIAKAKIKGADITFQTHIANIDRDDQTFRYHVPLPGIINFIQRRAKFRLSLTNQFAPKVILVTTDKKRMEGIAENISTGGIRAKFENPSMRYWQKGDRIPNCTVQLSPTTHIIGKMTVSNCDYNRDENILVLGTSFTSLSRLQESSIDKYVAAMKRGPRRNTEE